MNQTTRLIINADDLGAGDPTDRGIIEAFTNGIVSSASLLANGPSFESAIEMVRATGLPIGIHLNLSEGYALTGPIRGLTDQEGQFLGKKLSRQQFLSGQFDASNAKNEMIAQINKVKQTGLQPDHLDTHQHCGLFPSITPALIAAATESKIDRMRIPLPIRPISEALPSPLSDEMLLYQQLAPAMLTALKNTRITTPDGLLGMSLLNRLDEQSLDKLLNDLQPGTWELMVHPGYFDPQRDFSGREREQELTSLTSKKIQTLIQNQQINLINFRELPCDC
jgi:predicted glycoside hydrolase/deacetylase ChbG (UPF0249 family)